MDRRTRWIAGLILVAAGLVSWPVLAVWLEARPPAPATPEAPSRAPEASGLEDARGGLARAREPAAPESAPAGIDEPPPGLDDGEAPPARDLDAIAASFLTPEPRVAELLGLCQEMAAKATIDPASLQVERDGDGSVRFARGEVAIGDLRGTFLIEEGTYGLRITSTEAHPPWGTRDLQISFAEDLSRGQVTVQFHPRAGEPATRHVDPGEERLVGWGVSFSPDAGALARPLTVRAEGEAWQIGEGAGRSDLELPWLSASRAMESWMRRLEPHSR